MEFVTKDSGERQEYSTGMVRDLQAGKPRYDLVDWSMIKRWAELMERGAKKYVNTEEIEEWGTVGLLHVSSFGVVKYQDRVIPQWINKWGYKLVTIADLKPKHRQVHRLVMEAFIGPSKLQVNHKDYNRQNNHLVNLEYLTAKANIAYSKDHYVGTQTNSILTFDVAEEIRRRNANEKSKDLAKEFGISPQTVCDIVKRRTWGKKIEPIKKIGDGSGNWKKASTREEADRFRASALRHCIQWYVGETDEDHGAAVYFNISGYEMVKEKMKCLSPSL